jgi:MFS family permease
MVTSVFIVSVALVFVVTAPTAVLLFAATGLIGVGQSLYPIARITILKELYPDRVGSALGVTMASGDLGQTLLPPVAGALVVVFAWQAGLGFVIPLLVIAGISMWFVLPVQTSKGNAADSFTVDTVRYVLRELSQPDTGLMTFIIFLYLFIWQSFTTFYPTYLVEVKGLSSSMASFVFSLYFAAGVVVKPLSGLAYDQVGLRRSLILILVTPFIGFVLLTVVEGFWSLAVVTVLVSTILGSGAITQSHLANSLSDDMRGTGLGVIRTITATLGATGPVLFGIVAERGYFSEGYTVLAILVLTLVVFSFHLPRT